MSVYAWGANSHGQLGLGFESELCMSPQLLRKHSFAAQNCRCIRGGGGHVLILDNNGRIHACGWNNRGQLGLNMLDECINEFQCIPSEFFDEVPVQQIACGWDISGCITVTKKLYVWGSNSFQQLGICQREFNAVRRPLPVSLPRGDVALRITFGLRFCAILTEQHKVYIFGRLRLNDVTTSTELCITGTSLNRANVLKVQPANAAELRIINAVAGQNHLLLKILDLERHKGGKRIIALGDGKFGQANSFQFEQDIKQIAVGWTHNAVLLQNHEIMCWGRNCYGQCGTGYFTDQQATPAAIQLSSNAVPAHLHMGSEHALLRTKEGTIYTWGWNEHGNCGNNATENICSPTLIELPAPARLAGVGAGFCFVICEQTP